MFYVAIERYRIPIDNFSYIFLLFNFAIVGTTAIFFQRGIPTYITQGYLVATSVILAWQLSHFDPWTTWALLIMLALYDLCAVLTPCGPLKALVNLMQEEDSPEMPGLLYEAHLPAGTRRPGGSERRSSSMDQNNGEERRQRSLGQFSAVAEGERNGSASSTSPTEAVVVGGSVSAEPQQVVACEVETTTAPTVASSLFPPLAANTTEPDAVVQMQDVTISEAPSRSVTGFVPFAIARLYRLPLVSETSSDGARSRAGHMVAPVSVSVSPLLENGPADQPSPTELSAEVEVRFPRNGGRIEKQEGEHPSGLPRYNVYGRDGELRRVLLVDLQGRVYQETDEDSHEDDSKPASIRLGLGDFIFYSLLVAQAAVYGFTTFLACMLVILAGLGGTLVLLSVYHKALPALPISIFLGVTFYLLTRVVIEPWIQDLLTTPFYV